MSSVYKAEYFSFFIYMHLLKIIITVRVNEHNILWYYYNGAMHTLTWHRFVHVYLITDNYIMFAVIISSVYIG